MTVLITLTTAGLDSGPFDLYSDATGYVTPFATGVAKSTLLAGYTSTVVPNGTTVIRVTSIGACTNYVDLVVSGGSTTTTTTTPTPTTTSTTTPTPTTTSTTTPTAATCITYFVDNTSASVASFTYTDCNGTTGIPRTLQRDSNTTICAALNSIVITSGTLTVTNQGSCTVTTTTTPFISYYNIDFSNSTPALTCGNENIPTTYPISLYCQHQYPVVGDVIYIDSGLSVAFEGDGSFYWASLAFGYQINGSGVVLSEINCA